MYGTENQFHFTVNTFVSQLYTLSTRLLTATVVVSNILVFGYMVPGSSYSVCMSGAIVWISA